jgi:hypothetical protein
MEIDITAGKESCSINVENPHRIDSEMVMGKIITFGERAGIDLRALNIEQLISRMMNLVREGFGEFRISYIEGGILSAVCSLRKGGSLSIKVFPDFD